MYIRRPIPFLFSMADKSKIDLTTPLALLIGLYVLSLFGLRFHETQEIFIRLIPLNLTFTAGVLLYYQKHWNLRIIVFCLSVFLVTLIIAAVGLHTGKIFGSFRYGRALGPKVMDVPVVMGFIWLILVYCTGLMVKNLNFHYLLKAGIAAAMMVMFDVILEPVAMKLGMWGWQNKRVPVINYVAWFFISYVAVLTLLHLKAKLRNELAPYVFCIVSGFFLVINLF